MSPGGELDAGYEPRPFPRSCPEWAMRWRGRCNKPRNRAGMVYLSRARGAFDLEKPPLPPEAPP